MKEYVPRFLKIAIYSFTIICWILVLRRYENKDLPVFLTNPLKLIEETIQSALEPRIERNVIQEPEAFMKTPEIIAHRGYPVQIHQVVTDDGYILELHRIPFGRRETPFENSSKLKRKAVFLQHGLFLSDHMWLFGSSNNSLAYILADHGYDVWLGNSRGNVYSRRHVSLNSDTDREYWNFSWDEMGHYDIPASIDYVLNATGEKKLTYIGYSSGVSTFFMGAIRNPELNDKVEVMIGLGPTVSLVHSNSFFRYMAPFVKSYQVFQQLTGIGEVYKYCGLFHLVIRIFCETSHFGAKIGRHMLFQIFGYSETYEENFNFRSTGHHPSGSSANSMAQFLQIFNSGESFVYFDHGPGENLIRYGTTYPPEYNLTQVTVPVYLVHADNDDLAPNEDVSWLMSKLGNLKGSFLVDNPKFTHGDFIWSPRLAELVNLPILHLLPPPFA